MFFVYQRPTKKVHEFKDFHSLIEHYKDSQISHSSDLFWTLGLKAWIPISHALPETVLKKKKLQIPTLPSEALNDDAEEVTQPGVMNPISDEITSEIKLEPNDFVIVSYERPPAKAPAIPTSIPKIPTSAPGTSSAPVTKPSPQAKKPQSGPYSELRKSERHDIRLKVIISNKEKTFLSYTANVSTGGVMLEDTIPRDYFNSETEIFISSPKKNEFVAFRCIPVGDDAEPKRFSFGQISKASLDKFQDWIDKLK